MIQPNNNKELDYLSYKNPINKNLLADLNEGKNNYFDFNSGIDFENEEKFKDLIYENFIEEKKFNLDENLSDGFISENFVEGKRLV